MKGALIAIMSGIKLLHSGDASSASHSHPCSSEASRRSHGIRVSTRLLPDVEGELGKSHDVAIDTGSCHCTCHHVVSP
ncbi:hypothetical protein C2E23DRAFT_833557 [Lenzites betulinus]|nr:hypothetical protein C2E23DRAFT_833557 [Lenzites betulinus]